MQQVCSQAILHNARRSGEYYVSSACAAMAVECRRKQGGLRTRWVPQGRCRVKGENTSLSAAVVVQQYLGCRFNTLSQAGMQCMQPLQQLPSLQGGLQHLQGREGAHLGVLQSQSREP